MNKKTMSFVTVLLLALFVAGCSKQWGRGGEQESGAGETSEQTVSEQVQSLDKELEDADSLADGLDVNELDTLDQELAEVDIADI